MKNAASLIKKIFILLVVMAGTFSCKDDDNNSGKTEFKNIALSGDQEVPTVNTNSSGTFNGTYDKGTKILTYTVAWTLDSGETVTAMHFHGPATPTSSAGVQIPITGFSTSATGSLSSATPALTSAQEADLLAGKYYINIHSNINPGGEIRGNLLVY